MCGGGPPSYCCKPALPDPRPRLSLTTWTQNSHEEPGPSLGPPQLTTVSSRLQACLSPVLFPGLGHSCQSLLGQPRLWPRGCHWYLCLCGQVHLPQACWKARVPRASRMQESDGQNLGSGVIEPRAKFHPFTLWVIFFLTNPGTFLSLSFFTIIS